MCRFPWDPYHGKHSQFRPENLPHVPLLVNMKAIPAHHRLTVYFAPNKKQEGHEDEEEQPKKKKSKKERQEA